MSEDERLLLDLARDAVESQSEWSGIGDSDAIGEELFERIKKTKAA